MKKTLFGLLIGFALALPFGATAMLQSLDLTSVNTGVLTGVAHGLLIGQGSGTGSGAALTQVGPCNSNVPITGQGGSADPQCGGTIPAANGGTGAVSPTAHGLLVAEGSSPATTVGPCTTSQAVIGQGASADPACGQVSVAMLVSSSTTVAGQTCTLGSTCGLSTASNVLGADVPLNNTANYFDGPSMAQGGTGTWFVGGNATVHGNSNDTIRCKLWDGTTVLASTNITLAGAGSPGANIAFSGFKASPAGNLRISCRNFTSTTGTVIASNDSANSADSTIWGFRLQ